VFRLHERSIVVAAIGALLIVAGFDVWDDAQHGEGVSMLLWDVVTIMLAAAVLLYIFILQPYSARIRNRGLERQAVRQAADLARLSELARKQLEGLGAYISAQFDDWRLTPAEKDVALMLLKGFSMKEIANLRGISERTARQQATTVYGKAGLTGRAALSAYFLEDLLLPSTDPE
jgi:DNA-binding CsgD family transcriptional regulator